MGWIEQKEFRTIVFVLVCQTRLTEHRFMTMLEYTASVLCKSQV